MNPELIRQHEEHKARRQRIYALGRQEPTPAKAKIDQATAQRLRLLEEDEERRAARRKAKDARADGIRRRKEATARKRIQREAEQKARQEMIANLATWQQIEPQMPTFTVPLEILAEMVLKRFEGVTIFDVRGRVRNAVLNRARYLIAMACRHNQATFVEIGGFMHRHHSAVVAMVSKDKP